MDGIFNMKELRDLREILVWFIGFAVRFMQAFGFDAGIIEQLTGYVNRIAAEDASE